MRACALRSHAFSSYWGQAALPPLSSIGRGVSARNVAAEGGGRSMGGSGCGRPTGVHSNPARPFMERAGGGSVSAPSDGRRIPPPTFSSYLFL